MCARSRLLDLVCLGLSLLVVTGCNLGDGARHDGPTLLDLMSPGGDAPPIDTLRAAPWLDVSVSRTTGAVDLLDARGAGVLVADQVTAPAPVRARRFLADFGAVVGLSSSERAAMPVAVRASGADATGQFVRLRQQYEGLPVLGGELVVRMNDVGVTGVSGVWIRGVDVGTTSAVEADRAASVALASGSKEAGAPMVVTDQHLAVYPAGLLQGVSAEPRLAWSVEVAGGSEHRYQVWVDAVDGRVLDRHSLVHDVKYRRVFTPTDATEVANEDNPPIAVVHPQPVHNLFRFSGQVYDFFSSAFAWDSYDNAGHEMHTVYLVNNNCPNAYWNGQNTNYCPEFDLDDVVAHEWGHAYTQFTHGLIYSYESGALNEAYSDIWGDTIDLLNNEDGDAGANNDAPAPAGNRWAVGEDFGTGSGEYELLLRDMCDPERLGYPGSTQSANYHCASGDQGGVHTNSGVANHAYALLVDGSEMCGNGVIEGSPAVTPIGFTKAAAIYFRASSVYQTPTTNWEQHADALEASCEDLINADLQPPVMLDGIVPPDGTITAADCQQVANAIEAVGLRLDVPCEFDRLLEPGGPDVCTGAAVEFAEDFENGLDGWTTSSSGVNPEWPNYNWEARGNLPSRDGQAAFAPDRVDGTCAPGGDYSGTFSIDSPMMTAPSVEGAGLELRFYHYVETELLYDGGNVLISVDGGPFELIPQEAYTFNAPAAQLDAAPPTGQNTNPKAGQWAWHGADEGGSTGSWGTTVVNMAGLVAPGSSFQVRFDFGIDGCNGVTGWFVDDVRLYSCPPLDGPTLTAGADYEDPDADGSFTVEWERPAGTFGPDQLQQSSTSCAPLLDEDCEGDLSKWTQDPGSTSGWGSDSKPNHDSAVFRVVGVDHTGTNATLTTAEPIALGATARSATLSWMQWYVNEPDDKGIVEVTTVLDSPAESDWVEVYSIDRALEAGAAEAAFADEPMSRESVDLSAYLGESIRVRFRYHLGDTNYFLYTPKGWYIDDIAVEVDEWAQVLNDDVSSASVERSNGDYCFRVRTHYEVSGQTVRSDWSELLILVVDNPDDPVDSDGDTVPDPSDNCADNPNTNQIDSDEDGIGDVCDECALGDADGDGFCDSSGDNCPGVTNPDQEDDDGDGFGNVCDDCEPGDVDGDRVCDDADNCPDAANADQIDEDQNGVGDACDEGSCVGEDCEEPGFEEPIAEGCACSSGGGDGGALALMILLTLLAWRPRYRALPHR